MCKAVLQKGKALDVVTAAQGGTCAIIKAECCIYIQDYDKNMTRLFTDMNNQIHALKDPTLSLNNWLHSWSGGGLWLMLTSLLIAFLTFIMIIILMCFVSFTLFSIVEQMTDEPYYSKQIYPMSTLDSAAMASIIFTCRDR